MGEKRKRALAGTVVHQLPRDVDLRAIQAHLALNSGLDSAWGETYLLVHASKLLVLTRSSVMDPYQRFDTPEDELPRLEVGTAISHMYVTGMDGRQARISVSSKELADVQKFLDALGRELGR